MKPEGRKGPKQGSRIKAEKLRVCLGRYTFNFLFYHLAFKFRVCPLKLNVENLTFTCPTGRSHFAWKTQYFLSCIYGLVVIARLLKSVVERGQINLIYLSIHTAVALMALLNMSYYRMFLKHKGSDLLLVNQLLKNLKFDHKAVYGIKEYLQGKRLLCSPCWHRIFEIK